MNYCPRMCPPWPSLTVSGDVNADITMGTFGDWPASSTETIMDVRQLCPGGSAGNVGPASRTAQPCPPNH